MLTQSKGQTSGFSFTNGSSEMFANCILELLCTRKHKTLRRRFLCLYLLFNTIIVCLEGNYE